MERVHVIAADTEATPNEIGTSGSNVTYRVGNSVRQAAEDARRQLLRIAGQRLKADEEELVLADDAVFRKADPAERVSVAALARAAAGSAEGTILGTSAAVRAEEVRQHGREQAETVDSPAFGCHVAQIRVDGETGQVEVERYCAVHDVGHALNPMNCVGQVQGGVVFGLGYALSEELITQDGTNVNANLWEYLLPTAPHVPEITVDLVEVPSTFGPFGAKGLGEAPVIGVAAAIANAVEDAIGVRVTEAPLTPERVLGRRQ
jgi:CO/xanthine dehydrogenase Mo-binding subunit